MRMFGMLVTAAIFIIMLVITGTAAKQMSIPEAWPSYAANPWAVATLYDAYSGFLIYWMWVAYRERSTATRVVWFILIMVLGNIATSAYLFWQLKQLRTGEPIENALIKRTIS